jgi:DNA-binding transcriptional regulator of glucitol operon
MESSMMDATEESNELTTTMQEEEEEEEEKLTAGLKDPPQPQPDVPQVQQQQQQPSHCHEDEIHKEHMTSDALFSVLNILRSVRTVYVCFS